MARLQVLAQRDRDGSQHRLYQKAALTHRHSLVRLRRPHSCGPWPGSHEHFQHYGGGIVDCRFWAARCQLGADHLSNVYGTFAKDTAAEFLSVLEDAVAAHMVALPPQAAAKLLEAPASSSGPPGIIAATSIGPNQACYRGTA